MSYVYEQSTGRLELRCCCGDVRLISVGYSGHARGLNNPSVEHEKNVGPIPQGVYRLVERRHPRFAAPAFFLQPVPSTAKKLAAYGRGGFWLHGDNARADHSASTGCIVINRSGRERVREGVASGHGTLVVVDRFDWYDEQQCWGAGVITPADTSERDVAVNDR